MRGYVAGGLVGLNDGGTVSRSHASIDLPNFGYAFMSIGGLVGRNDHGTISQSYATGDVTGGKRSGVGGLVGYNYHGLVEQSYALGSAAASPHDARHGSEVGGLVGHDVGTIAQSYSTGPSSAGMQSYTGGLIGAQCCHPGFTTASCWDTTTSGSSFGCGTGDCSGVTGLTDAELKSGLPAGFDPAVWGSSPAVNGGLPYLLAQPPQ
ncbi:MAG: hypothetical protein JOZ72_03100 [Alphaproteobacteria bacterium]|nr:hypothetical protein [Alphaproteobacteria bacterium]